jgi:riboflavin synthase
MFTGVVQALGRVCTFEHGQGDATIGVEIPEATAMDLQIGESIAVNGVCLTVVRQQGAALYFDVSAETLSRTNLAVLDPGATVNLERAMSTTDRFGGHLVSGHVDGIATLAERTDVARSVVMRFTAARELAPFFAEKGSVAMDGVSLTVNRVVDFEHQVDFEVNVVPHTLQLTTLGRLELGDQVHVEVDLLARYVKRLRDCELV